MWQPKTDEQKATISARLLKREEAKRAKLVALGIDYDFSGYAEKVIAAPVEAEVKAEAPKAIKGKKEKKEKVVKEKKSSEVSGRLLVRAALMYPAREEEGTQVDVIVARSPLMPDSDRLSIYSVLIQLSERDKRTEADD